MLSTTERLRTAILRRIGRFGSGRFEIHSAIVEALINDVEGYRAVAAKVQAENMRLRKRIADLHNHDIRDIANDVEAVFEKWLPKVRAANRAALRPE
jgi:hypothetical protein